MTYTLPIRSNGERCSWWANFTKKTRETAFPKGYKFITGELLVRRSAELKKYNAVYDGTHVHFESEKDASLLFYDNRSYIV